MTIVPIDHASPAAVDSLLDRAFEIGRRARTAYRLREGVDQISDLSFAALDGSGTVLATIQCWPVTFRGDDGRTVPMILVGPVAVDPDIQRIGIGQRLTRHVLEVTEQSELPGSRALMLIGDPEYYGRFFGFTADRTGGWRLPGPVDPRRLLALGNEVPWGTGTIAARMA